LGGSVPGDGQRRGARPSLYRAGEQEREYVTWQEADDYMAASFFMLGDIINVQR
jgi:hypothetical protein